MGVFVAVLLAFYSNLMKWVEKCQEARLRFLLSFDMVFGTSEGSVNYDLMPQTFPKPFFVSIFTAIF